MLWRSYSPSKAHSPSHPGWRPDQPWRQHASRRKWQDAAEDMSPYKKAARLNAACYSRYHCVDRIPPWLPDQLPVQAQQDLTGPLHPVFHVDDLSKRVRVIFPHGLELRLTPKRIGLYVSWWYHFPIATSRGQHCMDVIDYISPTRSSFHTPQELITAARVGDATPHILSWSRFAPNGSAHEEIAFQAMLSKIPESERDLGEVFIQARMLKGQVLRFPGRDVFWSSTEEEYITVHTGPISEARLARRLSEPGQKTIARIHKNNLAIAAMVLEKEVADAGFKKRTHIRYLMATDAVKSFLSFFRRRSKANQKDQ
jgi:hypothetical protein